MWTGYGDWVCGVWTGYVDGVWRLGMYTGYTGYAVEGYQALNLGQGPAAFAR